VTIVGRIVGDILRSDSDTLVAGLGDFNDFYSSDALATVAEANGRGPLTNQVVSELPVGERDSYVFEGNSQALDQMLLNPALVQAAVLSTPTRSVTMIRCSPGSCL
jgi:predicted extracellular nuclease